MDRGTNVNLVYRIVHALTRTFFQLYGQLEVVDYHKLPKTGAVIAAPNHVSYVDPPLIGSTITRECAFMARHDLWDTKFLAWLLPKLGSFQVTRGKGDRSAIRSSLAALEKGLCLVLFPEGGRSDDTTLQRAEPGVALIVQRSGAPVVPIALIGPETMLPVGSGKLKRVKLKVVFGDPLHFTPDTPRDELLRSIMSSIAKMLTEHGVPTTAKEEHSSSAQRHSEEEQAVVTAGMPA